MLKKLFKLMIAIFLVEPAVIPAAPEKEEFHYASFGASQTAGFGMHGFLPEEFYKNPRLMWGQESGGQAARRFYYSFGYKFQPENAYPNLVGEALQEKFGASKKVVVDHSEMSGTRARDFDYLVNPEKEKDAYYNFMISWNVNTYNTAFEETLGGTTFVNEESDMSQDMINRIKNADLISYDYGINDFGAYLLNLAWGGEVFSTDLSQINPKYEEIYQTVKGAATALLMHYASDYVVDSVLNFAENAINTLAYAFVGFVDGFDSGMKKIYELNPNAPVVVVEIQNIYEGLMLDFGGSLLPVGEILGGIIDMANVYMSYLSPFANKYYVANFENKDHVELFIDQIANWDETVNSVLEMTDFLDSLNVYSGLYVEDEIKKDIFDTNHLRYTPVGKDATTGEEIFAENYDEAVAAMLATPESDSWHVAALQDEIIRTEKSKIMYYAYAKAFKMAANEKKLSLSSIATSSISFSAFKAVAKTLKDAWTPTTNMDEYIQTVDSKVAEFMNEGSHKADILLQMYNAGYACSFFEHPTPNGHVETKEAIMRAYENKDNKRLDLAKKINSVVDGLHEITMEDVKAALERIAAIANKDQEATDKTRAEVSELVDLIKGYVDMVLPYIEKAKEVYGKVKSTLDELGISEKIYADVIEKITPVKEKLEVVIAKGEELLAKVASVGEMSLEELRALAPEIAAGIDGILVEVSGLGEAIKVFAEDFSLLVGGDYENGKFASIEAAINVIIKTKEVMDEVASFAEGLYDQFAGFVKEGTKAICETAKVTVAKVKESIEKFLASEEVAEIKKSIKSVQEMLGEVEKFLAEVNPYLAQAKAIVESIVEFAKENITSENLASMRAKLQKAIKETEKAISNVKEVVTKVYEIAKEISSNVTKEKVEEALEKAKAMLEVAVSTSKATMLMIKKVATEVAEMAPVVLENVKSFIKKAVETYDVLSLEVSKIVLNVAKFVSASAEFVTNVLKKALEVKQQIEEIVSMVNAILSKVERTNEMIKETVDHIVSKIVATYNAIPEQIRALIERAVGNVINRMKGDFALLYSQIASVVENSLTSPVEEVGAIVEHINQMEIDIVAIIEKGINDAINTVYGGAVHAFVTVTVVAPTEIVCTINDCVISNTTNLVTTVNNGIESIIASVVEEIYTDPSINFTQKEAEVNEAYNEMVEAREEAIEKAEDVVVETGLDVVSAVSELLSRWHLY